MSQLYWPPIGAMLLAVVLDRHFHVVPAHVEVRDGVSEVIMDGNLSLRPRQTRP